MTTFVLTVLLIGALMAAMAVGVIFSNRQLQGSCGGEGGADCACDAQGIPRKCETGPGPDDRKGIPRDVVPTSAFGRRKHS